MYMNLRKHILTISLLIFVVGVCFSQNTKSNIQTKTKIASNDLLAYYEKDIIPPYKDAILGLNSSDDSTRISSAEYIYALCIQSLADETNGRSEWSRMPYFYETWNSKAKDIRDHIAYDFSETARSKESIKIAKWFITNDYNDENQLAGIKVIRETKCQESDECLGQLVTILQSNEEITVNAIMEISNRNLLSLSSQINLLQKHYREKIRDAAYSCAVKFGIPQKRPNINETVTPWITSQYENINKLLLVQIPSNVPLVKVVSEIPNPKNKIWTLNYTGWIITEDSDSYTILDYSGQTLDIEKKYSTVTPVPLKEIANEILNQEDLPFTERHGIIRSHAFDWAIPYFTVASACFKNSFNNEAASLILKRINGTSDDSTFTYLVRNSFGNLYYNELLYSFSFERDYKKSIILAKHLSMPEFYDFRYRKTVLELVEQLKNRNDDFIEFRLPSKTSWDSLKQSLKRDEQINYLAKRLRLLNCIQWGQPGDISYMSEQYSVPIASFIDPKQPKSNFPSGFDQEKTHGYEVINPYEELLNMSLSVKDLKTFVPYLFCSDYILGYSFFRDFQPQRTLHKVNWAVSNIILKSVGKEFLDMSTFDTLDTETKQYEIKKIIEWCDENQDKTQEELTSGILDATNKWSEFSMAMTTSLEHKYRIIPILVKRINDFNSIEWNPENSEIAKMIFNIGLENNSDIEKVKALLSYDNMSIKFWTSLCLIKYSHLDFAQGLETLKSVLEQDNGINLFPLAIESLLETKNPEALHLAEGILSKEGFIRSIGMFDVYNREIIKRLLLNGSDNSFRFLLNNLNDFNTDTTQYSYDNTKSHLLCDEYLEMVSNWKNNEPSSTPHSFYELSIKERKAMSKNLCKWLDKQYRMIKAGQISDIKTEDVQPPIFKLDAPGF
jgi:hypothetical protein